MYKYSGGGIMFPNKYQNNEAIFENYLDNSEKVTTISKGVYGITFLLDLSNNINTTNDNLFFKKMTPNAQYGDNVKQLVVKFQFVLKNPTDDPDMTSLDAVSEDELKNEVNIQTDIVLKTLQYLQPLCPSIVYADIVKDPIKKNSLYEKLIFKADKFDVFKLRKSQIKSGMSMYNVGIIAMELANDSTILYHYSKINPSNKIVAENISRYAILKLALDTEYNHGDFHQGNILIQKDSNYFLSNDGVPIPISPVLIDFGRAAKIPPEVMKLIRENVKNKQT